MQNAECKMQNDRKRLIELIVNAPKMPILINGIASGKVYQTAEHIADYLLANGVIVPPCKVGDMIYYILDGTINKAKVEERYFNDSKHGYYSSSWIIHAYDRKNKVEISFSPKDMSDTLLINGELVDITVFLSREEAEKTLKEMEKNNE